MYAQLWQIYGCISIIVSIPSLHFAMVKQSVTCAVDNIPILLAFRTPPPKTEKVARSPEGKYTEPTLTLQLSLLHPFKHPIYNNPSHHSMLQ